MTRFVLEVNEYVLNVIKELCAVQGSHLTVTSMSSEIYIASICPEYFKIYKTGQKVADDFAIRIPKAIVKPLISDIGYLVFTIDGNKLVIRKLRDKSTLLASVTVPLELDFNTELISSSTNPASVVIEQYDLSPLAELRALVPFSTTGIQIKDGLAYVHGQGFIAYHKIKHNINFILTHKNIAELLSFTRLHGTVNIYESGVYIVFQNGNYYFGCRQPAAFVDSNYSSYEQAVSVLELKVDLSELFKLSKNFTLPKNERLDCTFDLAGSKASILYNADCQYVVTLNCERKDYSFKLPVNVLKQIFTNTKLCYSAATLFVYESFVTFRFGNMDLLITRSD